MSGYAGTLQQEKLIKELDSTYLSDDWQNEYLDDVQQNGFQQAHRRLLESVQHTIETSEVFRWFPLLSAWEALQIHHTYLEVVQLSGAANIAHTAADTLFATLFGAAGIVVLSMYRSNLMKKKVQ